MHKFANHISIFTNTCTATDILHRDSIKTSHHTKAQISEMRSSMRNEINISNYLVTPNIQ
jgi:hypothetical protein